MKKTAALILSIVMILATMTIGGEALAGAVQTATVTPSEMYLTVHPSSTYPDTMQTCYERVTFAKFDFTGLREQLQNATKIYVHLKTMYSDATFGNFRIAALKQEHENHINSGMTYSSADSVGAVADLTYQLYRIDGVEAVGEKAMALELDKENFLKALNTGNDDVLGLRFDRFDWGGANTQFYPNELKITFEYLPAGNAESSVMMISGGMLVESAPDTVNWGGIGSDDNGKIQYMNDRKGYVLFDLSAHEAELYGATEIKLVGACAQASWWDLYNFNTYALMDDAEQYLNDSCTYENVAPYVWDGGNLCATGIFEPSADNFELSVNKEAILSALESGTNGIVALRFEAEGDGASNSFLKNDLVLKIIYDTTSEGYVNYIQNRVKNLQWLGISSQAQNRVYKDIVLPSQLAGQDITWRSDNESVIKSNGEVINGNVLQTATLTATVGEYSKDFEVVVTPEFYVDTPCVKVEEETAEIVFASYNGTDSACDYVAVIAVYEGKALKAVYVEDIESSAGDSTVKPFTLTDVCSKYNVKAFAWNNMKDMVPLCINAK